MLNKFMVKVKEVKNRLGDGDFYSSLIIELRKSTNLSKLIKKFSLSKQQLNYHLRKLVSFGIIEKKGRGWYEVIDQSKKLTKYDNSLVKDSVRGHAYVWKIYVPEKIQDWHKRTEIIKRKGMNYKLVGAKENTPRIKVLGRKVWLCNDHIRIFDKKGESYYGDNAIESRKKSLGKMIEIVRSLENKLGFIFKPLKFSFQKEHYALIKNDLAIEHNTKGEIMRISDGDGEWLLIDDSLGEGGELENIGKKALSTNMPMQKWWNNHKETGFKLTPDYVMNAINRVTENQNYYAENIKSHVETLQKIGSSVEELTKVIKELKDNKDK